MTATGFILYEVDINEIRELPFGFTVLQQDTVYNNCYRILQVGVDKFSANTQRFKYYLFQAPPLPALHINNPQNRAEKVT